MKDVPLYGMDKNNVHGIRAGVAYESQNSGLFVNSSCENSHIETAAPFCYTNLSKWSKSNCHRISENIYVEQTTNVSSARSTTPNTGTRFPSVKYNQFTFSSSVSGYESDVNVYSCSGKHAFSNSYSHRKNCESFIQIVRNCKCDYYAMPIGLLITKSVNYQSEICNQHQSPRYLYLIEHDFSIDAEQNLLIIHDVNEKKLMKLFTMDRISTATACDKNYQLSSQNQVDFLIIIHDYIKMM